MEVNMRPSSLSLQKTLRESVASIQDLCLLPWSGCIVTYDKQAFRLWDLSRQLKSVHHDVKKDDQIQFVKLATVETSEVIIAFYTTSSKEEGAIGGQLRVFSEYLSILQQIDLGLPYISRVFSSPSEMDFILLDTTKTANVITLETIFSSEGLPVEDSLMFGRSNPKMKRLAGSTQSREPSPLFKLHNVQLLDCSAVKIRDMILVEPDVLFVLTEENVKVLTRPALRKEQITVIATNPAPDSSSPKSRGKRKQKEVEAAEVVVPKEEDDIAKFPFHEFTQTACITLRFDSKRRRPSSMSLLKPQTLMLAYYDGWVDIFQFSEHLISKKPKQRFVEHNTHPTSVLCSFQAYYPPPADNKVKKKVDDKKDEKQAKNKRAIFVIAEANRGNTYGVNGYATEFFTLDADRRLMHWALRPVPHDGSVAPSEDGSVKSTMKLLDDSTELFTEFVDFTKERVTPRLIADFLGDFQLQEEPPSNVNNQSLHGHNLLSHSKLMFIELNNVEGRPAAKQLLGTYGGMIMLWDVVQPHHVIKQWSSSAALDKSKKTSIEDGTTLDMSNMIISCARGPDLSPHSDHHIYIAEDVSVNSSLGTDIMMATDRTNNIFGPIKTLFLMKKDIIEMINAYDGSILQSFSIRHLKEVAERERFGSNTLHAIGSIAYDSNVPMLENEVEGHATVMHWCPYTQLIFVGYATGNVGVMPLHPPIGHPRGSSKGNSDLGFTYIHTSSVHSAEITYLRTFPFQYNHTEVNDPLDPIKSMPIQVLLVGDINGVFTLWQISPRRAKSALLFKSKQHIGRICSASLCFLPHGTVFDASDNPNQTKYREVNSHHNILITACDKGLIHAWRMEQNLKLHLLAFFHASRAPFRLQTMLCIPKMIYRKVIVSNPEAHPTAVLTKEMDNKLEFFNQEDDVEMTVDAFGNPIPKPKEKKKEEVDPFIEMATLFYEIYCVMGFSDGRMEVWTISTDTRYCSEVALYARRTSPAGITSISAYTPTITDGIPHEPVGSIMHEFTLVNLPVIEGMEHDRYLLRGSDLFVCAHHDGTIMTFQMDINPLFSIDSDDQYVPRIKMQVLSYFRTPSPVLSIIPLQPAINHIGTTDYDYAVISDFAVYDIMTYISDNAFIPSHWHQSSLYLESHLQQQRAASRRKGVTETSDNNKSNFHSLQNHDFRLEAPAALVPFTPPSLELLLANGAAEYLQSQPPLENVPLTGKSTHSNKSELRRQFIGQMETNQRILSSDFHFAKKDKRLLELFTFQVDHRDSAVSADIAIEIIAQWANESKQKQHIKKLSSTQFAAPTTNNSSETVIKVENLRELFAMLDIVPSYRLKFAEVAKVAAITSSAMKKLADSVNANNSLTSTINDSIPSTSQPPSLTGTSNYQKLKTTVKRVSYNSMGEKVYETVAVSKPNMGLPDGSKAELRKMIYSTVTEQKRINEISNTSMSLMGKINRKLQAIPKAFRELITPQVLPLANDNWSENNLHYFDVARTIRVARSLLDLRYTKQHEITTNNSLFKANPSQVDSLPKLTIQYFERQFGECSRSMNVSRYKISNFLEACLQYNYLPIIRLLEYCNQLDETYARARGFDTAIWLVVEARNIMLSRNSVVFGDVIDKHEKLFFLEINANHTSNNSAKVVRYQYIPQAEAMYVIDELLRTRGSFGPQFYITIMDEISKMPVSLRSVVITSDTIHNTYDSRPKLAVNEDEYLLDFEGFLEELFRLFLTHYSMILHLENRVFGEHGLNIAITAVSREISTSQKRPMIINDEVDFANKGFGKFHVGNMKLIKELLFAMLEHDSMRSGEMPEKTLVKLLESHLQGPQQLLQLTTTTQVIAKEKVTNSDFELFYHGIKTKLKVHAIDEENMSYIDIITLLFAWEEQTAGNKSLTLSELKHDMIKLERAVEASFARDLIRYVSKVSTLPRVENPLWVMGNKAAENPYFITAVSTAEKKVLSIPTEGDWHLNAVPPVDEPGMLHAAPAYRTLTRHTAAASMPNLLQFKSNTAQNEEYGYHQQRPRVLSSKRERSSIFGETAHLMKGSKSSYLQIHTLSENLAELNAQRIASGAFPSLTVSSPDRREVRSSYSRLLISSPSVIPAVQKEELTSSAFISHSMINLPMTQIDFRMGGDILEGSTTTQHNNVFGEEVRGIYTPIIDSGRINLTNENTNDDNNEDEEDGFEVHRQESTDSVDSNYQPVHIKLLKSPSPPIIPKKARSNEEMTLTPFLDFTDLEIGQHSHSHDPNDDNNMSHNFSLTDQFSNFIDFNRSLASEEIGRRIAELKALEEEFQVLYDEEKEEFKRREIEKEILRIQIKREMLLKYRQGMKYYRQALDIRQKWMDSGRQQLAMALEQEMRDKKQKELEIQRILMSNRQKVMERMNHKKLEELAEQQREREQKERETMKKEEKHSLKVEQAFRKAKRKEIALKKAQDEQAWAERLAQIKAEQALLAAQQEEEEARQRALLQSAGTDKDKSIDENDLLSLPEMEPPQPSSMLDNLRQCQDEEEEEDGKGDDDELVCILSQSQQQDGGDASVETRPSTVNDMFSTQHDSTYLDDDSEELTPWERRIRKLLRNIENAWQEQNVHPRRVDRAFFLPLTFTRDVVFDPFASLNENLLDLERQIHARNTALIASNADANNSPSKGGASSARSPPTRGARSRLSSPSLDTLSSTLKMESTVSFLPSTKTKLSAASTASDEEKGLQDQDRPDSPNKGEDHHDPSNPFADIDYAVQKMRKQQDYDRSQLYAMKMKEVPTKDWTPIYKVSATNWQAFFDKEQEKLEVMKQMELDKEKQYDFVLDEDEEKRKKLRREKSSLFDLLRSQNLTSQDVAPLDTTSLDNVPKSLLQVLPEDVKRSILPLPFGKVQQKQILFPGAIKFYQIEVLDAETLLTIEVKCTRGLANFYIHFNKLPSPVKYLEKAHCKKDNDRTARLTIMPEAAGRYFVAITSPDTGAEYDIWAYSTGASVEENEHLRKVSMMVNKMNLILEHPDEELHVHFPRIFVEAQQKSDDMEQQRQKTIRNKGSVLREMRAMQQTGDLEGILHGDAVIPSKLVEKHGALANSLDELENIESYIVKVGRFAMRREREISNIREETAHLGTKSTSPVMATLKEADEVVGDNHSEESSIDSAVFEKEDPNQHAELFTAPVTHRSRSIALFTPVQQMSFAEELRKVYHEDKADMAEVEASQTSFTLPAMGLKYSGSKQTHRRNSLTKSNSASILLKLPDINESNKGDEDSARKLKRQPTQRQQQLLQMRKTLDENQLRKASLELVPPQLRMVPKPVAYSLSRYNNNNSKG